MEEPKDKALDEVFDSALALHHEITEGTEDTASKALQDKVGEANTITIGTINITIFHAHHHCQQGEEGDPDAGGCDQVGLPPGHLL